VAAVALFISVVALGLSLWALMMARQAKDVTGMLMRGRRDPFLPFDDHGRDRNRRR